MDSAWFDAMSKVVGRETTRRQVLGGLLGTALGSLLAGQATDAKRKRQQSKPRRTGRRRNRVSGAAQGNSPVAKACQAGGWATLAPAEDNRVAFGNQGACVSYGAQGGTLVPVVPSNPNCPRLTNEWFQDLRGVDLSGCDLSGAFLQYAHLEGATLINAKLTGANLNGAWLRSATLTGADLTGANLVYALSEDTNYSDATLTNAALTGASMSRAIFDGANLGGAILYGSVLQDASFARADLTGADLQGAYMWGANLANANLTGADLRGANLPNADLTGAILDGVLWSDTDCPDGSNSDANGGTCEGHLV